ncbi:hypothetical protein EV714DRAFT_287766 [Schizophyllum commune]
MQPTLDPLPNQPTRFSHPSSVEEGWCRCLHRSANAPTPATSMPPLRFGRPSSHGSLPSGVRPLMTAYSRPSTVLLPLPLCRYAVVRGGLAAVRGAPDAVICSHILP